MPTGYDEEKHLFISFLSRLFTNHRTAEERGGGEGGGRGGHFFNSSLPLPSTSQTHRHLKIAASPEKSHFLLLHQPPLKIEMLDLFENFVGRSTSQHKERGLHTMKKTH